MRTLAILDGCTGWSEFADHTGPFLGFVVRWLNYTIKISGLGSLQKQGSGCSVGCASDWWSGGCGFDPRRVGNILSWRLIMRYFLRSFSPFRWFRKVSCQFPLRGLRVPISKLTALDMTPLGWMCRKTSTQTNKQDWIQFLAVVSFFTRKITFVTFCLVAFLHSKPF